MKKIFATLGLIIFTISFSFSQTFEKKFLGYDFMQYMGELLKIDDKQIYDINHKFYSDLIYCQDIFNPNVIYPSKKYSWNTSIDSLTNRIFKVEDIVSSDGKTYNVDTYPPKYIIFVLRDTSSKQLIYFMYDKKNEFNFPFLTSKKGINKNTLCNEIERVVDDFTDEISLNSPYIYNGEMSQILIYKKINKTTTKYYLRLHAIGNTLNVGEFGAIILFDDGTKISKSVKIDVDPEHNGDGWEYKAYIPLTQYDLQVLSTKKIKKYRLYVYDEFVDEWHAEKFVYYVKCIKDKK